MRLLFVIALAMQYFFGFGEMKYFIQLIRALQMILHLPIIFVLVPGNVSMFYERMIPIVMFDILENQKGYDTTLVLKYDLEQ